MIGPEIPARLETKRAQSEKSDSESEDKPVVGPVLLSHLEEDDDDGDSEDEIGPKPLPSGTSYDPHDGVREFIEREERRQQLANVSEQFNKVVVWLT
jgi:hypothetical protein